VGRYALVLLGFAAVGAAVYLYLRDTAPAASRDVAPSASSPPSTRPTTFPSFGLERSEPTLSAPPGGRIPTH
jgi:hypothetical protein